jgi:hypothetical protein
MRRAEDLKPQLTINVYHASQDGSSAAIGLPGCCGAYHTGVEINGTEYAFAGVTGIYECRPGDYGEIIQKYHYQSTISAADIKQVIDALRRSFPGDSYHVILNNCNNFSDSLNRACTGSGIPAWINRGAWWLSWFKCCFPLFESNSRPEQRPLLTDGQFGAPPRQMTPLFVGEGTTLGGQGKNLSPEEQRQLRLRALGGQQ